MKLEDLPPELVAFCKANGLCIITLERYRELREKEYGYDAIQAQSEFLYGDIEKDNE